MENYTIETFKNKSGEIMYKLIEVDENGEKVELARLDYIQLKNLFSSIKGEVKDMLLDNNVELVMNVFNVNEEEAKKIIEESIEE